MNRAQSSNVAAQPFAFSMPGLLLRVEGLAMFLASVATYIYLGANGWLFLLLILAPDLSMVGYLRNPRVGAVVYNLVHTLAFPLALLLFGGYVGNSLAISLALIWIAHIGMDRTVGYGLKYSTAFKDTHLNRV